MSDKTAEKHISRPLAISTVAVLSFLLGIMGTAAGVLLGFLLLITSNLPTSFAAYSTFLTIIGIIIGPILVYSSYNLWKMRKWAAQAIIAIILFDFTAPLVNVTFSQPLNIGIKDVLAYALDIITLLLLASAWKNLQ